MQCNKAQQIIEHYLDSELPLSDKRALEDHLEHCHGCSRALDGLTTMSKAIKRNGVFNAPASLKRKVRKQLQNIAVEDETTTRFLPWLSFSGGALVFVSVMIWGVMNFTLIVSNDHILMEELIGAHVRSLMVDHATDIASSDRHTVKPWFNGKLDFAPPVLNFPEQGFTLTGGRLDYLQNRTVSALIYHRRAHMINLFMWPSHDSSAYSMMSENHQGYNLVGWSSNGLQFWVVSDLNTNELLAFANMMIGKSDVPPS